MTNETGRDKFIKQLIVLAERIEEQLDVAAARPNEAEQQANGG